MSTMVIRLKLNERIKKSGLDEASGVSNRELARRIGISHVALFKLRNGREFNPSLRLLNRLCEFFKCQPGDILEYRKK